MVKLDKSLEKQTKQIREIKDEVLATTERVSVIANNLKAPLAQILTFMIQRELHQERNRTADEARAKGVKNEYLTAYVSPIAAKTTILMNYLAINQFFQSNNDIPKAAAAAGLGVNIIGGTMLSVLEKIAGGLIGNGDITKQEQDRAAVHTGLKAINPHFNNVAFLYDQISKRYNVDLSHLTDKIVFPNVNLSDILGDK